MLFQFAKLYSWLYGLIKDHMNINIKGISFLLRRIKDDRVLSVKGCKMFFNHHVGPCYTRLISGYWNEPETHQFLGYIINNTNDEVEFIDVGANIGEMVIDVARYKNVMQIYAFEPVPECARSIEKSIELNNYKSVKIIRKVVSDSETPVQFKSKSTAPYLSGIALDQDTSNEVFYPTTLDVELPHESRNPIILVDVEGFEPYVLRGGSKFIAQNKPLIIFEYNHISKNYFSIKVINEIIGREYRIFRLRKDGKLDTHTDNAWNCVAIHSHSPYWNICESIIVTP